MNSKLRKIIRNIAIGSLVGILPNGKSDAATISSSIDERLGLLSNNDPDISAEKPNLTLKYVYDYATDDGKFHASHSSHASHASHYSSSSSSGTDASNKVTNTVTDQNTVTKNPNNYNSNSSSTYKFGDRTLKFGMEGTDVLELKKALIQAKCYKMGEYEILNDKFDDKTLSSLNLYKKNHQLTQDGLADALVYYHLKSN